MKAIRSLSFARYRKEATGSLDDEVLRNLDERLRYLRNLEEKNTGGSDHPGTGQVNERIRGADRSGSRR